MTLSTPGGGSPAPDAFTGCAVPVTGDGLGREIALGAAGQGTAR